MCCSVLFLFRFQLSSVKTRLQITEDRLYQERANRAGKLSDVEEKLLAENARLKVIIKRPPSWILF